MNTRVVLRFQPGISQTQVDFFYMMKCALLKFHFITGTKLYPFLFLRKGKSVKREN